MSNTQKEQNAFRCMYLSADEMYCTLNKQASSHSEFQSHVLIEKLEWAITFCVGGRKE